MSEKLMINIGCGTTFHPAWVNLDSNPSHPAVRQCDVRKGLPFAAGEAAVCYAAHVLEHLTHPAAKRFVIECHRVLQPLGTLRLVVPDLEAIAHEYLRTLEGSLAGSPGAAADYDWIMLELFDQMVRTDSGGDMHRYLTGGKVENPAFVISRAGIDAENLINPEKNKTLGKSPATRLRPIRVWRRFREQLAAAAAALLLGTEGRDALKDGLFRRSGQLHLWMYDRFSLARLLEQSGFTEIQRCKATQSRIPDFQRFELDDVAGRVRKPDSLFIEAVRP